jgi:DNA helicase-2/ATP-dependent DNA helicase PcrA
MKPAAPQLFSTDVTPDFRAELNDEQYRAVVGGDGPCLVLAGAGSGKTRVIVYRVAYLISRGVAPEDILLLTFTNKAAAEMMGRIARLLGEHHAARIGRAARVTGGTFHSVANRLLREFASHIGYTARFTILDDDDQKTLLKAVMRDLGLLDPARKFPSPAVVRDILSYRTNAMVPLPVAVAKKQPRLETDLVDLERVMAAYDNRKRQADAMDFDDLLLRFYELLASAAGPRATLANRFRYILVDEYQDTNPLQASIVSLLSGGRGNVLVVGDDAQSIYSFRAADVRNILHFPQLYPGAQVYKLETNYRSSVEILDLANDVIAKNANQFPKDLKSVNGSAGKPVVVPSATAAEEARFIVARIDELLTTGTTPGEIAVLFRSSHHAQALEIELVKVGYEYDYRGGVKFFDRAHIKDLLAFVRLSVNFRDEAAWLRILNLMPGVGEATASKIFALMMEAGSLAHAVLSPIEAKVGARAARGWKDLHACLEAVQRANGNPKEIVGGVRQAFYRDYAEGEYPDATERLGDVRGLEEFAGGYGTADELLAEITLDDAAFKSQSERRKGLRDERPKIVLSTVHQAKGLEWDAVFVLHLTDSGFPNGRAAEEEDGLEEERRLFYVAVTRARRKLWLCYPMTASFGSFSFETMSRFISEADPNNLDWKFYDERIGRAGTSGGAYGGATGSGIAKVRWGGRASFRADSFGEPSQDADGFYEEPTVSYDPPSRVALKPSKKKPDSDWRSRSFLG